MSRLTRQIAWPALLILLTGTVAVLWWYALDTRSQPPPERVSAVPREILESLDTGGFPRVPQQWDFVLPADHGPHSAYRTEWWYLTGTLIGPLTGPLTGRERAHLGLQLVLARLALAPEAPQRPSAWATSEVYLALFTLSDPNGGPPISALRTSRAALGLAGAETGPARIWLEDWQLEHKTRGDTDVADWHLKVSAGELTLDLELQGIKTAIPSSDLDRRVSSRSPPFHLYILPRLKAQGAMRIAGEEKRVEGVLSLEHAWGELPLPGGPVARDRFTLYLDDGRDLLCVRTHRVDGSGDPDSSCVLVDGAGSAQVLSDNGVKLEPTGYRSSPESGARYPLEWALQAPAQGLELRLRPDSPDAETTLWAPVWAGPVRLRGHSDAGSVDGEGFMQLSGYDQ